MNNKKKIKSKLIWSTLILGVLLIINIKSYALNVPTSNIYATSGDIGYWGVGKSEEWVIDNPSTSNSNVVRVWKRENMLYYEAKNPGTAYIYIRNKTPFYTASRKIVVSKPTTSYLKVNTGTTESVQPLIVGFEKTWNISTKYGWTVSSPNVGIIKVTNIDHNNGKITFKALRSDISYISGNPGFTYIDIMENYTGVSKRLCVRVKPYVNSIKISNYSNPVAGDVQYLKATTYPENYVGKAGYGKITWRTSNSNVATVDQKGNVAFKSTGKVRITVEYTDGRHGTPSAWVDYTVGKPTSKLNIKYKGTNNSVKSSSEIFTGFGGSWTITSARGWGISSPNNGIIDLKWDKNNNSVSYTAKKTGTTTITISEYYTGNSKTYTIKVIKPVEKIAITNKPNSIKVGSSYKLTAVTSPVNYVGRAGYGSVSWSSNNTKVATVDKNGNVKVKTNGKAIITVTYSDGKHGTKSDSYNINNYTRTQLVSYINSQIGKTGADSQKYYNAERNADWCCYFLGYCIDNILGKGTAMNKLGLISSNDDGSLNKGLYASDAGSIARAAERTDTKIVMHRYGDGYIPKPGDIFIMCKNDKFRTHVGFIKEVVKDKKGNVIEYKTIEGNANNNDASKSTVDEFTRTYDTRDGESIDTHIYGFIDLSYYFDN